MAFSLFLTFLHAPISDAQSIPFTRVLYLGTSGADVTALQQILDNQGYLSVSPTGYFGPLTETALMQFQAAHGLETVGSAGPLTRALLNSTNAVSSSAATPASLNTMTFTRVLYLGTSGADVTALQQILDNQGYLSVSPTGYFGPLTETALMQFQAAHGLEAVGSAGPLTRALLNSLESRATPPAQSSNNGVSGVGSGGPSSPSTVAPSISLTSNKAAVNSGDGATITWSASNATSCTASGNWTGSQPTSGSLQVDHITADRLFQLNCTNGALNASVQLIITVLDSSIIPTTPSPSVSSPAPTLSASSYWIPAGTRTSILWNSNGESCKGTIGTGDWDTPKVASGSETFTLNTSTDFQLVCTKSGIKTYRQLRINVTPGPVQPPIVGESSISSNFDSSPLLSVIRSHRDADASPDDIGAFRFICNPSHELYDDPIVFPGQPGKSHLHEFFGNTLTNANSTYQTLRTTGESTCNNALNRSAYWQPAMLNSQGKVVRPNYWTIYYKRYPVTSPACHIFGMACVDIPRGLKFIFGYDLVTHTPPTGNLFVGCIDSLGHPVYNGHDIPSVVSHCPIGGLIELRLSAPACWDGVRLDSSNHRDHISYRIHDNGTGGNYCPPTHPYIMPTFTLGTFFTVDADTPNWHLSSDEMVPGIPAGTTFHSDFFSAWDDTTEQTWTNNCINRLLNCSGGDLGNGSMLKMFSGFSWTANPKIVDPPSKPAN